MVFESFENLENFVLKAFQEVEKNDMEYIYRGEVTPRLVMNILELAKTNLEKAEDTARLKSRIYYIMGEGLQNITRHQEKGFDLRPENSAIIVIHKRNHKYYIATGNVIKQDNIPPLRSRLEKINSLTSDELKDFARYTRMTTEISEKGGASLGLIEMAKRSAKKLSFAFKKIDDFYSYFYLNTEIPTEIINSTNMSNQEIEYEYSLENLTQFHEILNKENFLLTFKGDFNQDNMLNLLNIVKGQMSESTTSIKVYNIMVELLQNIVKHADNKGNISSWKPGIFFISERENEFVLTAANYITNRKVEKFKARLDYVNQLSQKELASHYNKILFNFEIEDPITTGLGIIDMRRRSGRQLVYNFNKQDDNYTFFIIQVGITKKS